jgi:L-iditol 2-dehydrogenase
VLVRVSTAAVCTTDRRLASGGTDAPRVPGHEVAGLLEDGTPVGIHPNFGCGRCEWCARGLQNRCPDRVDLGIRRDGALAEWVTAPVAHVVKLDGFATDLAPLVEPLGCCLNAVAALEVREGDPALVVGAGSLGILGMWAMRASGAQVVVAQRSPARRGLALELGADAAVGPEDDVEGALGAAPVAALVTAPGADALRWALDRVAIGGRVHAFAGTPGGAPVDANVVHYRHLALVGSSGSTVGDYRRALELARSGAVPLERLPCEVVPFDRLPEILLDPWPDPRTLKFVVRPSQTDRR